MSKRFKIAAETTEYHDSSSKLGYKENQIKYKKNSSLDAKHNQTSSKKEVEISPPSSMDTLVPEASYESSENQSIHISNSIDSNFASEDVSEHLSGKKRKREEEAPLKPKFLLSVPMYVPADDDGDSSDEEVTENFRAKFNFNIKDLATFPYKTYKKNLTDTAVVGKSCIASSSIPVRKTKPVMDEEKPSQISQYLKKLDNEGFEGADTGKVYPSFGLNRMYSLSTSKNIKLLEEQARAEKEPITAIKTYKISSFYWEVQWYNQKDEKIGYEEVRSFYKQLKKINYGQAREFLLINESKILPPYQDIREYLRISDNTKELIRLMRDSDKSWLIYFTIMDGDVVNFNNVFSAYNRIIAANPTPPDVMSTGYSFSEEGEGNWPFFYAASADMAIRRITAKHINSAVYYPEPNTCILLPDDTPTLPESFIEKDKELKNYESPIVLRKVLQRSKTNKSFIFSEDNSIVTTIPARAKYHKTAKTKLEFSEIFKNKGDPTIEDIRLLQAVTQSHLDPYRWAESLYCNRAFILKGVKFKEFTAEIQKLCKILETSYGTKTVAEIKASLIDHFKIPLEMVNSIIAAATEVANYKKTKLLNFPNFDQAFEFARQDLKLSKEDVKDLDDNSKKIIIEFHDLHFEFIAKLLKWQKMSINQIIDFYKTVDEKKFSELGKVVTTIHIENLPLKKLNELYDKMKIEGNVELFFDYSDIMVKLFNDYGKNIITHLINYGNKPLLIELYNKVDGDTIEELKANGLDIWEILKLYELKIDLEIACSLKEKGLSYEDIIYLQEKEIDLEAAVQWLSVRETDYDETKLDIDLDRIIINCRYDINPKIVKKLQKKLIFLSIENILLMVDNGINLETILKLVNMNTETLDEILDLQFKYGIILEQLLTLQEKDDQLTIEDVLKLRSTLNISLETIIKLYNSFPDLSFRNIETMQSSNVNFKDVIERQELDPTFTLETLMAESVVAVGVSSDLAASDYNAL